MASITQYNGKWRAVVRRAGHQTMSVTRDTKTEAEKWARELESELGVSKRGSGRMAPELVHVRRIFERYLEEVCPDHARAVVSGLDGEDIDPALRGKSKTETGIVRSLMENAKFMSKPVNALCAKDIREWRDARLNEIKPASVNRQFNTLSSVLSHAIKEWEIPLTVNPCSLVSRPKNSDVHRDKRWVDDDVQKVLAVLPWGEKQYPREVKEYVAWAFLLAIETAMRQGEICRLRVSDFFPEEHYVFVRKSKNGDKRKTPLTPRAAEILHHLCAGRGKDDKIFNIASNTLSGYFAQATRDAGLGHLHFHDSRHEAATRLSKKLSNVLELSAVTGHRSLKSLKRYYNPTPSDIAAKLA